MSSGNVTVVYPDAGELPYELAFEKTLLIAGFLGTAAWGIHLCVYGAAMYFSFISAPHRRQRTWLSWALMVYMTVIFASATTYVGADIQVNIDIYIVHRNDPGGPYVYAFNAYRTPLVLIGINICPMVSILLTDALLIWRLYVIWGVYWILVLPVIMHLGSIVTGVLLMFTSAQPGHTLNSGDAVTFGTAFWSISLSMTVIVTLLIVGRLVIKQRQNAKIIGNLPEHQDYISAWTILLESSALYTIFGFIYLILYNRSSPANNVFDALMGQVVCISSDLIILRVGLGCSWKSQTSAKITSVMMFRPPLPTTSTTDFE